MRPRTLGSWAIAILVLLLGGVSFLAFRFGSGADGAVDGTPIGPVPTSSTTVVSGGVRVSPGTDLQQMVDSHPSGTTFVLETGTHRNQRV
ncbi:MAG: hypothetical protein WAL25_07530, partial [Acidimicrobiia bacterium]